MLDLKSKLKKIPLFKKIADFIYLIFYLEKERHFDSPTEWLKSILDEENLSIVQIGSNDGVSGDPIHNLIIDNKKWEVLFVEPVPYLYERLKKNYQSDSRFTFANVAINDGTKQIFYSVKEEAKIQYPDLPIWYDQLGSFERNNIIKQLNGTLEPYIEETLLVGMTLKEVLLKNNINELSFLHIDTEGYDWKILSQLDLNVYEPIIILFEHKHLLRKELKESFRFLNKKYYIYKLGGDMLCLNKKNVTKEQVAHFQGELINP